MHLAAFSGHTATVSLLLEKGADIGAKDNVSNLTHLVTHNCSWCNIKGINEITYFCNRIHYYINL